MEIIADAAATLENEASPSDGDDDEDDGFDDGWDDPEPGFTIPGKLSPVQVELAKTVRIRRSHFPHLTPDLWSIPLVPPQLLADTECRTAHGSVLP